MVAARPSRLLKVRGCRLQPRADGQRRRCLLRQAGRECQRYSRPSLRRYRGCVRRSRAAGRAHGLQHGQHVQRAAPPRQDARMCAWRACTRGGPSHGVAFSRLSLFEGYCRACADGNATGGIVEGRTNITGRAGGAVVGPTLMSKGQTIPELKYITSELTRRGKIHQFAGIQSAHRPSAQAAEPSRRLR
jgi:hypothetical protein